VQLNYLDPNILSAISGLDLVAKTVVHGFINGLHRSPDFGFSQEFAEYRMYTPGDDLRHVDWNVFARTERAYLKRYRGETNTRVTVMLDLSKSMSFGGKPTKLEYARFLVSSILYLAVQQRDAAGLILFDDAVQQFIPPSSRVGQLQKLLHAVEKAEVGQHTDFAKPFQQFLEFVRRRGVVIVVSDSLQTNTALWRLLRTAEMLRTGNVAHPRRCRLGVLCECLCFFSPAPALALGVVPCPHFRQQFQRTR